ncbi:MAG: hypothetical protein COA81_09930 [Alphaproteobacteria bacterium]|nr:MAG: hypothetical protein COA81_09930 [Alphaproteobacteria bacterium]
MQILTGYNVDKGSSMKILITFILLSLINPAKFRLTWATGVTASKMMLRRSYWHEGSAGSPRQ